MDPIKNIEIPRLASFYLEYLHGHDMNRLIGQVKEHYTMSTLIRLCCSMQVDARRAAAHILGFIGDYSANDCLGRMLTDPDRSVCLLAENSIKNIWPRFGSESQRHELRSVMRMIAAQNFAEAVRVANNLLEGAPLFAEARNQRAIALFALGSFQDAIEDGAIVLDLNPFHFGSAIGMAHAYLQLENKELAIACFQQALKINPNLESVRRHLARIEQQS